MQIKNIIFDFGGVLIDWNPRFVYRQYFETTDEMEWFLDNICTHNWNVQQDAGRSLLDGTEWLVKKNPEYEFLIRKFYDQWEDMLNGPISENVSLLEPLKAKYRLFGLTNWSAETFPIAREKYAFLKFFEGIVVSGEEKMIKPDPAIYKLILTRYGLQGDECIFIDDNLDNITTARSLGIGGVHFKEGISLEEALKKLDLL